MQIFTLVYISKSYTHTIIYTGISIVVRDIGMISNWTVIGEVYLTVRFALVQAEVDTLVELLLVVQTAFFGRVIF